MRYWKKRKVDDSFKVGIAVVTYNQTSSLAALIHSIKNQTFLRYKVIVAHDGPWDMEVLRICLNAIDGDYRFEIYASGSRNNKFGHELRQVGFDMTKDAGCNWICTMNGDCWYAPTYLEWMLSQATQEKANFVFSNLVHSHKLWKPMRSELERGSIDAGNWIAHTNLVGDTEWDSNDFAADWDFISKLKNKPNFKPAKVDGYIYVHN